jgi:hypothetical protein
MQAGSQRLHDQADYRGSGESGTFEAACPAVTLAKEHSLSRGIKRLSLGGGAEMRLGFRNAVGYLPLVIGHANHVNTSALQPKEGSISRV